jgi:hypothetical protein
MDLKYLAFSILRGGIDYTKEDADRRPVKLLGGSICRLCESLDEHTERLGRLPHAMPRPTIHIIDWFHRRIRAEYAKEIALTI